REARRSRPLVSSHLGRQPTMPPYTQAGRLLSVNTPLGQDVLLLAGFTGREEMSRLFRFPLDFLSEQAALAPPDIVGQPVTWSVEPFDKEPPYFTGTATRSAPGSRLIHDLHEYHAEVFPWLWFLTRTANCRIFQHQSVPDIVQAIFQ